MCPLLPMMISLPLRNTQHPLPTTAAGLQRLTPARRHHYNKTGGRARRRTAPTDLAQNWATRARPQRRALARRPVPTWPLPYCRLGHCPLRYVQTDEMDRRALLSPRRNRDHGERVPIARRHVDRRRGDKGHSTRVLH